MPVYVGLPAQQLLQPICGGGSGWQNNNACPNDAHSRAIRTREGAGCRKRDRPRLQTVMKLVSEVLFDIWVFLFSCPARRLDVRAASPCNARVSKYRGQLL